MIISRNRFVSSLSSSSLFGDLSHLRVVGRRVNLVFSFGVLYDTSQLDVWFTDDFIQLILSFSNLIQQHLFFHLLRPCKDFIILIVPLVENMIVVGQLRLQVLDLVLPFFI